METKVEEKRHYLSLSEPKQTISILHNGKEIAKSNNAVLLKEVGKQVYDQVYYIPRKDVNMEYFTKNAHHSTCPIKGEASYYNFKDEDKETENLAWSYETPLATAKQVANYLAFYSNQVTFVLEPIIE